MITLKTLPNATAQQVFDQVVDHLRSQNEKSRRSSCCAYKNNDDLKCAAGCLISDDEYNPEFEGWGWQNLVSKHKVSDKHCSLIMSLQNVHDDREINEWEESLEKVANRHNLIYSPKP